jgi:hypothetical protein
MDVDELRERLTNKLADLPLEKLSSIWNFVEELETPQTEYDSAEQVRLLRKWQYLVENDQEFDRSDPLSDEDITAICSILRRENGSRPSGLCEGEFIVLDNFNESLPDEILDSFYSL